MNDPKRNPPSDQPATTSRLHLEVKTSDKSRWVRKAQARKQKLVDFVTETLNKESEKSE